MKLFSRPKPVATVAFNMRPVAGPYGGGNQWVTLLARYLAQCGYAVRFDLRRPADCLLLTHAGTSGKLEFGVAEILEFQRRHPRVRCIHRINDNDERKGTVEMNRMLQETNAVADHTVFISEWLRDHHAALWFDRARPHSCILNGADPAVFHPIGSRPWRAGEPFRFVTHHWSDNPMKGFPQYAELDARIAAGELPGVELWMVGRWPKDLVWKTARTFLAVRGEALAALLRQGHGYVTASLWEPGGMHFIEGLQCGLPLLYHEDGGGIVELGRRYGVGFRDDLSGGVRALMADYASLREKVIAAPPSGDLMCLHYRRLVQQCLAH